MKKSSSRSLKRRKSMRGGMRGMRPVRVWIAGGKRKTMRGGIEGMRGPGSNGGKRKTMRGGIEVMRQRF